MTGESFLIVKKAYKKFLFILIVSNYLGCRLYVSLLKDVDTDLKTCGKSRRANFRGLQMSEWNSSDVTEVCATRTKHTVRTHGGITGAMRRLTYLWLIIVLGIPNYKGNTQTCEMTWYARMTHSDTIIDAWSFNSRLIVCQRMFPRSRWHNRIAAKDRQTTTQRGGGGGVVGVATPPVHLGPGAFTTCVQ